MQIGRMAMGEKDETGSIDQNVPLAACGPLCSVTAARWAIDTCSPHRLAVDDRR